MFENIKSSASTFVSFMKKEFEVFRSYNTPMKLFIYWLDKYTCLSYDYDRLACMDEVDICTLTRRFILAFFFTSILSLVGLIVSGIMVGWAFGWMFPIDVVDPFVVWSFLGVNCIFIALVATYCLIKYLDYREQNRYFNENENPGVISTFKNMIEAKMHNYCFKVKLRTK